MSDSPATPTPAAPAKKTSQTKQTIEIVILIVLVIVGIFFGIPAWKEYQQMQKAIAVYNEADECIHKGDEAAALAKFQEAIAIYPHLRSAYDEIAAIQYLSGDHDAALATYEKAIEAMPDNPDVYLSYSQMLFHMYQYEKARDNAKKAHELDSKTKIYKKHLDLYERVVSDPKLQERHKKVVEKMEREGMSPVGQHHGGDEHNAQEVRANLQNAAKHGFGEHEHVDDNHEDALSSENAPAGEAAAPEADNNAETNPAPAQ